MNRSACSRGGGWMSAHSSGGLRAARRESPFSRKTGRRSRAPKARPSTWQSRWRWKAGTNTRNISALLRDPACFLTRLRRFSKMAAGAREVWIAARNEGSWGNRLSVTLSFTTSALALAPADFFVNRLRLPSGLKINPGTTLRLSIGGGVKVIRRIETVIDDWNPADGSRERWAWLDLPTASAAVSAELVEGRLDIDDGVNPTESHDHLGLASNHPRWIASVLVNESDMTLPCDNPKLIGDPLAYWLDSDLEIDPALPAYHSATFSRVEDRWADITPDDFFDAGWVPGNDCPGSGIHSLTDLEDLSLLTAPDLYSPGPLAPIQIITGPTSFAGPDFTECIAPLPAPPQGPPVQDLTGLRLDP